MDRNVDIHSITEVQEGREKEEEPQQTIWRRYGKNLEELCMVIIATTEAK